MANYRVTWFFEMVQQARIGASAALGWTESWYLNNINGSPDLAFAHPDVLQYQMLRRSIMGSFTRISFVRVSDSENPRVVKIQALNAAIGNPDPASPNVQDVVPAQVQCALLADLQKLPLNAQDIVHHKRFLIRGLPSSLINGNILNTASPRWKDVTAFLTFLAQRETGAPAPQAGAPGIRLNLGIRVHDTAVNFTPIASTQATGNLHIIEVKPPIPGLFAFPNASQIEIRDMPPPWQKWNRVWTFLSYDNQVAPTKMILGVARGSLGSDVYVAAGKGRMRLVQWRYGPCDQYAVIGLRSKKTGRIFRQLRGRSSNRA